MAANGVGRILRLDVPIIVLMGEKRMPLKDVLAMVPGVIVELPKSSDEPLHLCVNNHVLGSGVAVKVGENFGIQINAIGDLSERVAAMGGGSSGGAGGEAPDPAAAEGSPSDDELASLAEQMLDSKN
ncbi:MAG TPA: FliM/FliN family flagellar motor C-terminal domain-containing protein [Phycisphaerales bacterium]|nr:FliM/FliN family flagellar motor C-terminal domain-containing protein [Phycisphaerales bacterium]